MSWFISCRSVNTEDEADEEVFFGPMGHMERCVATAVTSLSKEFKPLSPLNPQQFAEICKEANAVAARISSAVGTKRNKTIPKEQILCSKQLNMNKTPCIFSPKAVGKLLKAVSSRTDNTDNKENEMEMDSSNDTDKRTCDTVDSSDTVDRGDTVDSRTGKLPSLDIPLLDISGIAEISEQKSGSSSEEEGKTKGKVENGQHSTVNEESEVLTPSRRHNRSGTYTISKVPHEKLPAAKRKSLPIVSHASSAKKETNSTDNLKVKPSGTGKRSLDVPHKEETEKGSTSKLKRSNSKLVKPSKVNIPTAPVVQKVSIWAAAWQDQPSDLWAQQRLRSAWASA